MSPNKRRHRGGRSTKNTIPNESKTANEEETAKEVCDEVTERQEGDDGNEEKDDGKQDEAVSSGADQKDEEPGDETVENEHEICAEGHNDKDKEKEDGEEGADVEGENEERDDDVAHLIPYVSGASSDEEEESRALLPDGMYFPPIEYAKAALNGCKIGTRCSVWKTVEYLTKFPAELKWFRAHDQFKHVFHMPEEPNHQLQGMLMLVLRTARTKPTESAWFVVNGRPIRYSIREHAILTGFNCKEYPPNWKELGSLAFVEKVFGQRKLEAGIKITDVKSKLEAMKKKNSAARVKLAVLYFLCNVLKANNKNDGKIEPFLLRIVDDLSACETFPWGRYTFLECMDGLKKMVKNMDGSTKKGGQPGFSGFIIPLEIMPFECIADLGRQFRVDVSADPACPRMCKRKFLRGGTKGFSLDEINAALGKTKKITSILEPTDEERALFKRNVEDYVYVEDGLGTADPVVESWNDRLLVERKKVLFNSLYDEDVGARDPSNTLTIEDGIGQERPVGDLESLKVELLHGMDKVMGKCLAAIGRLDAKVVNLELILRGIQCYVATQGKSVRGGSPSSGFTMRDVPIVITPVELAAGNLDEAAVANQLMEMGKATVSEKADTAGAAFGNDDIEMYEQQTVADIEKGKEMAAAEVEKKKMRDLAVKQEMHDAVQKNLRGPEKGGKINKVYEAKKNKIKMNEAEERKQNKEEEEEEKNKKKDAEDEQKKKAEEEKKKTEAEEKEKKEAEENEKKKDAEDKQKKKAEEEKKKTEAEEKKKKEADEKEKKKEEEEKNKKKDAEDKQKKKAEEEKKKTEAEDKKKEAEEKEKKKEEEETKKKKEEEEEMKSKTEIKENDGEAEAAGKRKNEQRSDYDDEENKKKRMKIERLKRALGDVELVDSGVKRNRD